MLNLLKDRIYLKEDMTGNNLFLSNQAELLKIDLEGAGLVRMPLG